MEMLRRAILAELGASAVLPDLPFEAALHVNYASAVLPLRDGLPKQKDFPAEMGGSGELLPE